MSLSLLHSPAPSSRRPHGARYILPCLLVSALALPLWADTPAPAPDITNDLDQIFRDAYAGDGPAPGASVLVKKGDQILLRAGYGQADLELGVAIEPDMVFRLGSITKQFSAVAIMQLVEAGKLDLDRTLAEMLPDYPDLYDAKVTLRHLLNHTSGIPSYTAMPEFWDKSRRDLSVAEMLDFFDEKELEFEPGSRFAYNNSGYFLLGAVIEQVTGMTYAEYMQKHVFEPLSLSRSTYGDPTKITRGRVEGYASQDGEFSVAGFISMNCPYAAGSLLSNVDDLAKWKDALKAAYEGEEGILSKQTLDTMWTATELADGSSEQYGFGWQLSELDGKKMIHHGGGIHGFTTHALWIPDSDIFVAVLSNGHPQDPQMLAVQAAALASGKPLVRRAVELPEDALKRYIGVYRIDDETDRVVTFEDGALWTQRTGSGKFKIVPSSATEFFYETSLYQLRFKLEGDRVKGMIMKPWDGPEEFAELTDKALPVKKIVEISHEEIARVAGRYELQPGFILEIRREGDTVITQATGQGPIQIFPTSATEFFNDQIGGRIVFELGDDGKATSLTLFQAGREMKAPRLED